MTGNPSGRTVLLTIGLLAVYACAYTSFAFSGGDPYYNNDEPRHLLTGAFWADFLLERPLDDPVGFAKTYYTHFPALGIVHWPPLFHLLQAAAFLACGVSQAAAYLLMTAFLAVVVIGWYLSTRRVVGHTVALWSALLFPLAPEFFGLSGHVMLEIPALAWMILSVLAFGRFLHTDRLRWMWLAAACAGAAALTRQHGIIVLGPLLACWLGSRRWDVLKRKAFWAACLTAAVPVGGYYLATLPMITAWSSMLTRSPEYAWSDAGWVLVQRMGPAVSVLSCLGLGWAAASIIRRRPVPWVLLGWVAATLAMWLAVSYRPSRFLVYAWPALTTLGLWASTQLSPRALRRPAPHLVAAAALAVGALTLSAETRPPLGGYRDAAVAALQLTETNRIFFHGRMDGTFVWHLRQLNPSLEPVVFRASKVLAAGEDRLFKQYRPLAETTEQITDALDRLGVDVVVTEDLPEMEQAPFRNLLRALETERFQPIASFPLHHPEGRIFARRLTLYRFHRRGPLPDRVTLPMATLGPGGELEVDLSRRLRGWAEAR